MKFLATFAFLFISSSMAIGEKELKFKLAGVPSFKFNYYGGVKTGFKAPFKQYFMEKSAQIMHNDIEEAENIEDSFPLDIDYIDVGNKMIKNDIEMIDVSAATNFSWADYKAVSPVQDQTNHCMSGYVFAAVAAIESQMMIKTKSYQKLSEQEVLDCMPFGCMGGDMESAFNFSSKYSGIAPAKDYPYAGYVKGRCEDAVSRKAAVNSTVKQIYRGKLSPDLILSAGPVGLDMSVYENFLNYKSGIYSYVSGRPLFVHSVLIIGYGRDKNNQLFYLGKNSWVSEVCDFTLKMFKLDFFKLGNWLGRERLLQNRCEQKHFEHCE